MFKSLVVFSKNISVYLSVFLVVSSSAFSQNVLEESLGQIKTQYAPDKRTAIYEFETRNDTLFVKTDQVEAYSKSQTLLKSKNAAYQLTKLPNSALGTDTLALINVSVANIRSNPRQSAELATQALLGTPIKVLEKVGGWYRVQTPDKYIGYLEGSSFEYTKENSFPKVIVTTPLSFSKQKPTKRSANVSDITWGNLFRLKGEKGKFYEVVYPDGRIAYVSRKEAKPIGNLSFTGSFPVKDGLVNSGKEMMGIPYLWGGTSWKGVDCSGFTRTVFLMNGVYLPRDASQQALIGEKVEFNNDFSLLNKGDLLFFGRIVDDQPKVTHVAMSLGNARFIHSSGMVRISSLDPQDEYYDEYNTNRLLFVKRLENSNNSVYYLNNKTLY
ncbi:Cell wall-associated hydrolase, NlpC family [Spirosomataceae bacterium TFI 002]|nr:Cell wall-associated hydrolase, NlpC family [Spirosomataceae bacterium TFI 002]